MSPSGLFSSKASCSTTKKPSKCSRYSPSPFSGYSLKKRGRGRPRKQERENAASELKGVSTEKNDWPGETPESYDVNTPEKTPSHSNENATKMSFSDDDEDMNVDFDMDFDSSPTTEQPSKCSRYSPSPVSGSSLKKRGRGRPRKQERENSCSSLFLSGLSSKGSLSTTKEPSNCSRNSSSPISDGSLKKRGRGRPRKQERGNEASELKDVSTDKNDWPEDKPDKTWSHSNENATKMSFSDDDEDMNVDFDIDFDSDEDIRNEEYIGDGDTNVSDVVDKTKQGNDSSDAKKTDSSPAYRSTVADLEEAYHVEKDLPKKGAEQNRGSRRSCATLNTGKFLLVSLEESEKSIGHICECLYKSMFQSSRYQAMSENNFRF